MAITSGVSVRSRQWQLGASTSLGGGIVYNRDGLAASGRTDLDPFYFRGIARGHRSTPAGRQIRFRRTAVRGRSDIDVRRRGTEAAPDLPSGRRSARATRESILAVAGSAAGGRRLPLSVAGRRWRARPRPPRIERRHRGARPRARADTRDADRTRGCSTVSASRRSPTWHRHSASSDQPLTGNRLRFVGDAGIGIRAEHRIGDTRFVTRFDLPLFVSRPELAQDRSPGRRQSRVSLGVQLPARALAGLGAVRRTSTVCRSPSSTRVIASPSMAPPSTVTSTTPPSPPSGLVTTMA